MKTLCYCSAFAALCAVFGWTGMLAAQNEAEPSAAKTPAPTFYTSNTAPQAAAASEQEPLMPRADQAPVMPRADQEPATPPVAAPEAPALYKNNTEIHGSGNKVTTTNEPAAKVETPVAPKAAAPKAIVPEEPAPSVTTTTIKGSGNKVIVTNPGTGRVYTHISTPPGMPENQVIVTHPGGVVVNSDSIVYEGKGTQFWTKSRFDPTLKCDLFWCPKTCLWFRYFADQDNYRPCTEVLHRDLDLSMQQMHLQMEQMRQEMHQRMLRMNQATQNFNRIFAEMP